MNLGIILPLIIYLTFVLVQQFCLCKTYKRRFLTEYYVGNRSMTGLCSQ